MDLNQAIDRPRHRAASVLVSSVPIVQSKCLIQPPMEDNMTKQNGGGDSKHGMTQRGKIKVNGVKYEKEDTRKTV